MKKMRVLVTGGAGFIGSNIADALIEKGHSVVIVDNLSSGNIKNINKKAGFYKVDIADKKRIPEIFKREKIDVVIHHAAQIDVRKSVADPAFDAGVNVLGTLNLLEAARQNGIKKVIFASSGGTIYGECAKNPPDESFPGNPISPYGITKYTVEFYLKFYAAIYGMKYTALRYANVYGPRQDPHGEAGVVAIFSSRMLAGEPLTIFGNGRQTRDYVFVGDVVRANLAALTAGDNETINIGTTKLTSVNELFREMAGIIGYEKKPVYKPARAGEIMKSFLNNKKAKKKLNWQPQVALKDGLSTTIEYFKSK
jgi:UDP-glucose 4-epimerase